MSKRRRLLVLASTFPVSAADSTPAFVRDLAAYETAEFDTTVLVPAVPSGAMRDQGDVDVRRFRYFPRRWEDLADGAILENLRARRSRWLQVPPFLLAEIMAVRRHVKRLRPDVLHVHWIIPQGLAAMLGGGRVPMLVTTLGGDLYGLRDPFSQWVIRAVIRRAAAITTMNEEMRQRLIELGADPERTYVLPMGADTTGIRATASQESCVPGRLLFVGRLVEKKGLAVLLEALRELDSSGIELRVVGDGPLRAKLTERAAGLPVKFVGALQRTELAREYGAADVVVFPSVPAASGDQDGLPVALLEAMAAGCSVVASDLPGLRDAIRDGESGLLVAPGDSHALAATLRELLADAGHRRRLGAMAVKRSERYSVSSIGARYLALLDDIGSGRQPRSAASLEEI